MILYLALLLHANGLLMDKTSGYANRYFSHQTDGLYFVARMGTQWL